MTDADASRPESPPGQEPGLGRHAAPLPAGQGLQPVHPFPAPASPVTEYPVTFTGTAGEYFRLWIVNVALTLLTLGIYLPWARVRTRQYFYGHTWLDGQNFEYRANPVALLRGYLLVAALFVAYSLSAQFEYYWVAGPLLLLYVGLYPWLVRQSLRFQAANTLHRGLPFGFGGTVRGSYLAYGVANVIGGIGGLFALPWAWFMQRRYQLDHVAYGTARGHFRGDVAPFYIIAVTAVGVGIAVGLLALLPLAAVAFGSSSLLNFSAEELNPAALLPALAVGYLAFVLLYVVVWQYIRGATMKYVLDHGELGGVVRTRATFSPWRLVWIGVSNAAVTVLTLGLATPWAAIRRSRYVLQGIQVRAIAPLDDFAAGALQRESALGEAASELLDIQVGF